MAPNFWDPSPGIGRKIRIIWAREFCFATTSDPRGPRLATVNRSPPAPAQNPQPNRRSQLENCLRNLLGPSRQAAFSWKRPLREMGLDSLNLLEFRVLLEQTFGRPFSTTFFFSHPTLLDIKRYLEESSPQTGDHCERAGDDRGESGRRRPGRCA